MTATDYRCKTKEVATVPFAQYKLMQRKYIRREKKLIFTLAVSIAITIISNIFIR